jgi:hypothetical protein
MRRVLPLLAVLCLAFAPAPFPRPGRPVDDFSELAGTWVLVRLTEGVPEEDLRISRGRMAYGPESRRHSYRFSLRGTKRAGAFELTREFGGELEAVSYVGILKLEAVSYVGILKLEGEALRLSYGPPERGTPAAFDGPGRGALNATYVRKKP